MTELMNNVNEMERNSMRKILTGPDITEGLSCRKRQIFLDKLMEKENG